MINSSTISFHRFEFDRVDVVFLIKMIRVLTFFKWNIFIWSYQVHVMSDYGPNIGFTPWLNWVEVREVTGIGRGLIVPRLLLPSVARVVQILVRLVHYILVCGCILEVHIFELYTRLRNGKWSSLCRSALCRKLMRLLFHLDLWEIAVELSRIERLLRWEFEVNGC